MLMLRLVTLRYVRVENRHKTFGKQFTSLKIGIASQVLYGRHFLVVAVAVTVK